MTDTNVDRDVNSDNKPLPPEKRDDGIVRPGDLSAKLLACRERAGLDKDQAAIAMRLTPAMINALEHESFKDLPEPPYVRGYLRSYARLDESDPQDLIRTYELLRGSDPDSLNTPTLMPISRVQKPPISPTTVRMMGLVALVLLLGILSMIPGINQWVKDTWHSFAAAQPGTIPNPTAPKPASELASTSPVTGTSTDLTSTETNTAVTPPAASPAIASTTQDKPSTALASDTIQPSTPTTAASAAPAATPETAPVTLGLAIPPATPVAAPTPTDVSATVLGTTTPASTAPSMMPATGSPITPTTPTTATPNSANSDPTAIVTDPTKPVETTTVQQPIDGEVTVRMEFSQEVWMQVKDGSNKAIFEALNSPNTWKQFKTRTPLTFKIGNAPGVRLYLNGQAYDHAKYTRGSVARFTVN